MRLIQADGNRAAGARVLRWQRYESDLRPRPTGDNDIADDRAHATTAYEREFAYASCDVM